MTKTPDPVALHRALQSIWDSGPGLRQLSAVNHTTIGKRFFVTSFIFFAIGGVLAMLIRAQLATPESDFVGPQRYSQIFSMHGTVMMFLFAIPMLEGLGLYLLPKLLGARDMAFPRLSAFGYWCYLLGGSTLIIAMLAGVAPNSGWFMYTPLSSSAYTPGINNDVWLLGVTFVEVSAVAAAVEIVVTILKVRAPGMSLSRMPIFAWYMLVTAVMMLLGFPPLILGSILLEIERAFDFPIFDPTRGGDALLWQHLFWLFGHPEVYIIFLPAAGAVSTILPVFARHELIGYRAIVVAIIALGFLSFGLWVHHMFAVGIPHLALAFFSAASALVAIPTTLQFFAWIATLAHGRPRFSVPMLYLAGFFLIFIIGGLTGVMIAMVPFNWQIHDTHFVVAHLHYVLVGGFVFPMLAAVYYWLPHVSGRLTMQRFSVPAFWLIFVGFNLTFFLMHLTGLRGMPRRVHTYPADVGWEWLNLLSSIGGFLMTMGFALVVIDVIGHFRFGKRFRRDPWEATTTEWAQPTPPPAYNFASLPTVSDRGDRMAPREIGPELAAGRGYLGFARNGWMETLGVSMASGRIEQVIILPLPTYVPLWSALTICAFVLLVLFEFYWLSLVALAVLVGVVVLWTRGMGLKADSEPLDIGHGETAQPQYQSGQAPAWWGSVTLLVSNFSLYASLLFGILFLWLVAPGWPPEHIVMPAGLDAGFVVLAIFAASVAGRLAVSANAAGRQPVFWLIITTAGHLAAILTYARIISTTIPDPTVHAHSATSYVLVVYCALHSALGLIFALYCIYRFAAGYVSPLRSLDLDIAKLWHDYAALAGLIGIGLMLGMPALMGVLELAP